MPIVSGDGNTTIRPFRTTRAFRSLSTPLLDWAQAQRRQLCSAMRGLGDDMIFSGIDPGFPSKTRPPPSPQQPRDTPVQPHRTHAGRLSDSSAS